MALNINSFRISNKPKIIDWSKPVEEPEITPTPLEDISETLLTDKEIEELESQKKVLKDELKTLEEQKEKLNEELKELKDKIDSDSLQAEIIIQEANVKASEIITSAQLKQEEVLQFKKEEEERIKKEAAKIKEEANSSGYKEGRDEGRQIVADKSTSLLKSLETVLAQAVQEKDSIILEAEKQILDLAIAISRKIIRAEITINDEVINNTLKEAITRVTDKDTVSVYVNLKDLEKLTKKKQEILKKLDPGSRINIIEDENIEPGGLIISTNMGNIDATINGQELEIDKILKHTYEK